MDQVPETPDLPFPPPRHRLTLAMIVRDEEEMLPAFLESVAGLWDELVAVDTGSVDATPRLLEEAGAVVLQRPWDDDFAAARNHGLEHARGEWILYLDADERPSPEAAAGIRAVVADPSAGAATVVMQNRLPHGHHREAPLLRLFRNDPGIRFRHKIHEDVLESVQRFLARTGLRLAAVPGVVEHLGYVRAHAAAKDKKSRDLRLLERELEVDPDDLYVHFKRLEVACFWDDEDLARRLAPEARAALDRARSRLGPDALRRLHFLPDLAVLLARSEHPDDTDAALAALDGLEPDLAPSAVFHFERGRLRESAGDLDGAGDDFRRCLDLGDPRHPQLGSTRPLMGLARICLARNVPDLVVNARELTDRALAASPRDPEALLCATMLARALGGAAELETFFAEHAGAYGPSTELSFAVGERHLLAGDAARSLPHLRAAAGEPPRGRAALVLGRALLQSGDAAGAADLAASLVGDLPEAGIGLLVSNLARGLDTDLVLDLEQEDADRALREWALAALRSDDMDVAEGFLARAGAIAGPFPWLPDWVRGLLGEA